jgi:hypothetical protein
MSENILSAIPTDPRWQPEPDAASRTRALLARFAPNPDRTDDELTAEWHETITVVDCGSNLLLRNPSSPTAVVSGGRSPQPQK